jgi:hydroxymethylpyrimidine pyrophosphatase-like HAD family hydrolase
MFWVVPKLDAKNFDSAFMVDVRATNANSSAAANAHVFGVSEVSEVEEKLKKLIMDSEAFKGKLTICVNLGKGHITAEGCTKADVVQYLVKEKKVAGEKVKLLSSDDRNENETEQEFDEDIVAGLFDDENDIEFVKLCHIGFAPGVAHPAVSEFLLKKSNKEEGESRYHKCQVEGFLGTEEALSILMGRYCF